MMGCENRAIQNCSACCAKSGDSLPIHWGKCWRTVLDSDESRNSEAVDHHFLFGGCYFAASGETEDRQAFVTSVFRKMMDQEAELSWAPEAIAEDERLKLVFQPDRDGWVGQPGGVGLHDLGCVVERWQHDRRLAGS